MDDHRGGGGKIGPVQTLAPILAVVAAYLLGSLAFAVIVSRVMGLSDPRTFGSKNPGATNVLRSGSKPAAIVTLLFDALKGFVPVLLVKLYGRDYGMGDTTMAMASVSREIPAAAMWRAPRPSGSSSSFSSSKFR